MNYLTSVIAAHVDLSQVQSFRHAKRLEESVDAAILKVWRSILKRTRSKSATRQTITGQSLTEGLFTGILSAMDQGLREAHQIAAKAAQKTILDHIPVQVLSLATEGRNLKRGRHITEARATAAQRRRIRAELFDSVDEAKANSIIYRPTNGLTWRQRMAAATGLAQPEEVAKIVRDWAARQESPRALETALMPVLQNVRISARRVARTEAQRVATESRMDEYEKMGSWVIGYQIHGTMDSRIRPHHAARNGTIYYRNPTMGQLSMEKDMPRPPIDEDGTYAHNCRCWLTPIVDVQPQVENDPVAKKLFTDAKKKLVPDPSVYSDWFSRADDEDREEAVGVTRLRIIRNKIQDNPQWGHFLDPDTGRMMPIDRLRAESVNQMAKRMEKVNDLLTKRKTLAEKVANYGYLPPEFQAASKLAEKPKELPASYPKDLWKRTFKANKIQPVGARKAIDERMKDLTYQAALSYAVRHGSLAGFLDAAGIPFEAVKAESVAVDAQFIQATAKPISRAARTVVGLPPGTLWQAIKDPTKGLQVRFMAPIGRDVFDPLIRGMEAVEVVVSPGIPLARAGQQRFLPPGKYKILWIQNGIVTIGP